MRTILVLALAAMAYLVAGNALAHQQVDAPNGDTYYVPLVAGLDEGNPHVGGGDLSDLTVWQESNGCPGLQESPHMIAESGCAPGTNPDTQLL